MFFNEFKNFLHELNTHSVNDEWYMSHFADKHIKNLENHEAFDILKEFINYMISEYDANSEYEMVETLRYLRAQSNTRELFYDDEQKNQIFALYQQDFSQNILAEIFQDCASSEIKNKRFSH